MATNIIDQLAQDAGFDAENVDLDMTPVNAIVSPDSLFDPKLKAQYDAEPKKRVYIPTPDSWKEAYPYAERIEINGIRYIIVAEQDVMLPESVAAVWENKKAMERELNRLNGAAKRLMSYTNIDQVPSWYR